MARMHNKTNFIWLEGEFIRYRNQDTPYELREMEKDRSVQIERLGRGRQKFGFEIMPEYFDQFEKMRTDVRTNRKSENVMVMHYNSVYKATWLWSVDQRELGRGMHLVIGDLVKVEDGSHDWFQSMVVLAAQRARQCQK